MNTATLSDITGRDLVRLGGDFVHAQRIKGDLIVELTWHKNEPVMILYRAIPTEKLGAYIINLDDMWKYANSDCTPTAKLLRDGIECAQAIGYGLDKYAATRCIDAILENAADLLKMPPVPPELAQQEAPAKEGDELSLTMNGKTVFQMEL